MSETNKRQFALPHQLIQSFCRKQFYNQPMQHSPNDMSYPNVESYQIQNHPSSQISEQNYTVDRQYPKSYSTSQIIQRYTSQKSKRQPVRYSISNKYTHEKNCQYQEPFFRESHKTICTPINDFNQTFQAKKIDHSRQKYLKQINTLKQENKALIEANNTLKIEVQRKNCKIETLKQEISYQETIMEEKGQLIKKMSNFNDELCLKLISIQSQLDEQRALNQRMFMKQKRQNSIALYKKIQNQTNKFYNNSSIENPQSQKIYNWKKKDDSVFGEEILQFRISEQQRKQFKTNVLTNQELSFLEFQEPQIGKNNEKIVGQSIQYLNFSNTKDCQLGTQ